MPVPRAYKTVNDRGKRLARGDSTTYIATPVNELTMSTKRIWFPSFVTPFSHPWGSPAIVSRQKSAFGTWIKTKLVTWRLSLIRNTLRCHEPSTREDFIRWLIRHPLVPGLSRRSWMMHWHVVRARLGPTVAQRFGVPRQCAM